MEKDDKKQYAILPTIEGISDLTPQDQLVYLGIKSFMNKDTLEAYPSQKTVGDRIGCCDKTVRKSIKNLIDKNYISIKKDGRKTIYKFNKFKQFEPFSYAFIKDKTMTFTQKSLLASTQRYMLDKESGVGKIQYSKMELAQKINMPYSTLVRTTRELAEKDIIVTVKNGNINEMQFDLGRYFQGIVSILINHENRIEKAEHKVDENSENIKLITTILKKKFNANTLEEVLEKLENKNIIL